MECIENSGKIERKSWGGFQMSKWMEDFVEQYGETGTVRRLTDEINKANNLKEIDKKLSEVVQGKHKRRWR